MRCKSKFVRTGLIFSINLLTFFSMFGLVAGTVAWFNYSNITNDISYRGTAVGFDGGLLIGLISEVKNQELIDRFDCIEQKYGNEYIYWVSNALDYEITECYNLARGYSINGLAPVTSGSFATNDDFSLTRAPACKDAGLNISANKLYYSNIRMTFKEAYYNGIRSNLYLESVSLECTRDIRNGVRIHFGSKKDGFNKIFAPAMVNDGFTDVGGILDLDDDKYYDYNDDGKEYLYGEFEFYEYLDPFVKDEKVGTISSTFDAIHKKGNRGANYVAKKSQYLGTDTMINNKEVILQPSFEAYVPELDVDIYIEGWDRSVIEPEVFAGFSLYMTFAC